VKDKKNTYLKVKKKYLNFINRQEILSKPFFNKIGQLKNFYLPICQSIHSDHKSNNNTIIVGLSGGQGSGKTTIAKILKILLKQKYNFEVVCFSIDDFYKTLDERKKKSKKIHPLFLTRGVPGTHDILLLKKSLTNIKKKLFKPFFIPRFDKSTDDRYPRNKWLKIKKKPDIVIFEGWCVGAKHQKDKQLKKSINKLEKKHDIKLKWRKKVNNELKSSYKEVFNLINKLIFLQVPSFNYVYKWRLLQEKKLKLTKFGNKIMTKDQIKNFIMFYERITKQMIKDLNLKANIVVKIDTRHRLKNLKFN